MLAGFKGQESTSELGRGFIATEQRGCIYRQEVIGNAQVIERRVYGGLMRSPIGRDLVIQEGCRTSKSPAQVW
jgi:hypothetical protein